MFLKVSYKISGSMRICYLKIDKMNLFINIEYNCGFRLLKKCFIKIWENQSIPFFDSINCFFCFIILTHLYSESYSNFDSNFAPYQIDIKSCWFFWKYKNSPLFYLVRIYSVLLTNLHFTQLREAAGLPDAQVPITLCFMD